MTIAESSPELVLNDAIIQGELSPTNYSHFLSDSSGVTPHNPRQNEKSDSSGVADTFFSYFRQMANTYTKIYLQIVFAVKGRQNLILPHWEEELHKYITRTIQKMDQILVAINGMPDHIHILIGMKPTCCLSDLVREIKKSTNDKINENKWSSGKFNWQEGFGAFSYSRWDVDKIVNYIKNQKEHHKKTSFKSEYLKLLNDFEIDYKDEYLFDFE